MGLTTCLTLSSFWSSVTYAGYVLQETVKQGKSIEKQFSQYQTSCQVGEVLRDLPEEIFERYPGNQNQYREICVATQDKTLGPVESKRLSDVEVRAILKSGPNNNRIILTFLGDGYTASEKSRFYTDVERMVRDLMDGPTFRSYRSLFNIYAVFASSRDSGLSDRQRLDTAYDLYRVPAGSKRGIRVGNRRAVESALKEVPAFTDYPIIIANDDFYGGLGGRYAITTRSHTSGTMVLRHELGHNFSNVGEEYDGGQVYSGANFSSSDRPAWKQWIDQTLKPQRSKFLTGSYVWQDLGKKEFRKDFQFNEPGDFLYQLELSAVGWESENDVQILLDGKELKITGEFTADRTFLNTELFPIQKGRHTLIIRDLNNDGNNVLAFANGYAFPAEHDFTPDKVGAYNVFGDGGRMRGYRPTYSQCLMREMSSLTFCPVDQENIWLRLLGRVSLIDRVVQNESQLTVETLNLSGLKIKWFAKSANGWNQLGANQRTLDTSTHDAREFKVEVEFETKEIRKQSKHTIDSKIIKI